jgi:apolipoprotein N-acyltransferase
MAGAPKLAVAAVQGNIGLGMKWDPVQAEKNLSAYKKLTQAAGPASLVIWPETAVEFWIPENLRELPREIFPPHPPGMKLFIFGARSYRGDFASPDSRFFNSAFLTDGNGRILGVYHKQLLLAFGEYIPFWRFLSRIPGLPPLGPGFSEGEGPRTLDLSDKIRVAPLICYEDLVPFLTRGFVNEKNANLLVNLTNDAWYGNSAAPWQHARLSQWRAIETRRSLVRATNTGVTAVIDARGKILHTLPLFSPGILRAEVELLEGKTFYARFGDWLPWLATLLSLALIFRRFQAWLGKQ